MPMSDGGLILCEYKVKPQSSGKDSDLCDGEVGRDLEVGTIDDPDSAASSGDRRLLGQLVGVWVRRAVRDRQVVCKVLRRKSCC